MRKKNGADYDVGYGRPPKSGQFKAGQSGNPSGRPKGSKNAMAQLSAAANEKITVTVNGKTRRITKYEAMCKQLLNNALNGDARAQRLVFDLMARRDAKGAAAELAQLQKEKQPINIILSPEDMKL